MLLLCSGLLQMPLEFFLHLIRDKGVWEMLRQQHRELFAKLTRNYIQALVFMNWSGWAPGLQWLYQVGGLCYLKILGLM
jgi:hypothetical protein